MPTPLVLIAMGVSGVGKSTIARGVCAALDFPFQEGDDLHPQSNIRKMQNGIPLTDDDRAPWLAAIGAWIDGQIAAGRNGVITCSALKRAYRDPLVRGRSSVALLYLKADVAVIRERVAHRTGHFMPPSLLDSQLATLEEPSADEKPITVVVHGTIEETVAEAETKIKVTLLC